MKYEEPLNIVNFLNKEMIVGYCNQIVMQYQNICDKNRQLNLSPVYKNKEYNFYNIDYGFLIYVLEEYAKSYFTELEDNREKGLDIARKIHADFAIDNDKKLPTNGALFFSILEYHKLAFKSKHSKGIYTKHLFLNPNNQNYFALNSISFSAGSINEITQNKSLEDIFKTGNPTDNFMWIGFGKNANTAIKKAPKTTKIFQFWDRENGFTELLSSYD